MFAEFALHHLAVLNATLEGGRNLMKILSPESLADESSPDLPADEEEEDEGLMERLFPYKTRKAWRRYVALHQKLLEEDRFTRELFGRAFARAYYTFTGGRIEEPPVTPVT